MVSGFVWKLPAILLHIIVILESVEINRSVPQGAHVAILTAVHACQTQHSVLGRPSTVVHGRFMGIVRRQLALLCPLDVLFPCVLGRRRVAVSF